MKILKKFKWPAGIIIATVLILLMAVFLTTGFYSNSINGYSVAAEVNGMPVAVNELKMFMRNRQAGVSRYFVEKYKTSIDKNFWQTSFNGEIPIETLRQKALADGVTLKIKRGIALKLGLIEDASYKVFVDGMNKENERRAETKRKGEILYGPEQFSEDAYFAYQMGNMELDSKFKLGNGELKPTEEDLMSYYESKKDELYKQSDYIKVRSFSVGFTDSNGNRDEPTHKNAEDTAKKAKAKADAGENFEKIASECRSNSKLQIKVEDMVFDEKTKRVDIKGNHGKLLDQAQKLLPNQVSDVFDDGRSFYVIKFLERRDGGYKSFEEVSSNFNDLKSKYIDMKYKECIVKLVNTANITVNKRIYDRISSN